MNTTTHLQYDIISGDKHTCAWIHKYHHFRWEFQEIECIEITEISIVDASETNKPEDHWSCIAHLSAEDMLKSAVTEEKKFKYSPRVGTDNPFRPKF